MMAFLAFLYQYGLCISPPAFLLSVILLARSIIGAIRTGRQARLVSLPLLDRQEIQFPEKGRVVLCMEGPLLSRRFARLKYKLTGPDGMPVTGRRVLFRLTSSGFTKAMMELRTYEIALPGIHIFEIRGLEGENPSDSEHRMVFTRPHLAQTLASILAILFTSIFAISSLVLFFLRLLEV